MAGQIEDYALIGDLETAALVGRDGAIDWMCVPRFDSPACFAALLGDARHGFWRLAPAGVKGHCNRRSYRGDTLVLDSVWETVGGAVLVTDFMPLRVRDYPRVVRIVRGLSGSVAMHGELVLRFDNGRIVPWNRRVNSRAAAAVAGPDSVVLSCSAGVDITVERTGTSLDFTMRRGDQRTFVLDWIPSHLTATPATEGPQQADDSDQLESTLDFWRSWAAKCRYQGPGREAVVRSLITLKALTYAPSGGIVAAVTTSLPEWPGGQRNWDYRFCWIRDATLTLSCLMRSGYREEALAWTRWLLRAAAGDPGDLQPLYGVLGQRRVDESLAPWLTGYESSLPVRVGNAAAEQLQLDVYGEVLNALYSALRSGVPIDAPTWHLMGDLMTHLEQHWHEPDAGLWEVRGPPRHFVHSRIMAWVAADRALRMARVAGMRGSARRWWALRQDIHREVCARGWDADRGSFVQYYGSHQVDASALLIPRLGFLPAQDSRILGTLSAVRSLDEHGFLRRYSSNGDAVHAVDGMTGGEGAFLACTLWFADSLAMAGHREEATEVFRRVLDVQNDVGLLAEEWDPVHERQLGNFPQAFSHVALVNTAFALHGSRSGDRSPAT
ncbi:glycoside hydrolase family 15 protein [Streptomyces sp. NA04227]|uniref:glycoside hydrolase family 15 protein n=1 Tax=Streptomyces sp. NA04227 TaxID=2742136 RepID=UPI0015927638|nr:glycoside hydrolase family 15 protein [Streptomyces sp. NA04227]QKW09732.1 glycoside hydrolase family 15 protein [Streptomyces sp. NA04227]